MAHGIHCICMKIEDFHKETEKQCAVIQNSALFPCVLKLLQLAGWASLNTEVTTQGRAAVRNLG